MAGIADLFYLGQPDPARQIAQALSGQQQPPQPGGQQGPPGQSSPLPGGPAGQQIAPGANLPSAQATPTVYQSTPDMSASYNTLANPPNLMSLYLQMDARNRAEDQMNRGFALIAANHSSPAMARAIMGSLGSQGDASGTMGGLMQLYQAQQQMAGQQQMLGQADVMDQKLGLPPGTSRAMILAGRGSELVGKLEPTDEQRNIQAKHDMFIKSGGTEDDWQRNYLPFILTSGAGGGDSTTRSWQSDRIMWDRDHPGEPYPWGDNTPTAYGNWKTQQNEMIKDQEEARNRLHSAYGQNIQDLRNNLGNIVGLKPGGDPNNEGDYDQAKLDALKHALNATGAQAYLSGDPKDLTTQAMGVGLTDADKAILDQIREVSDKSQLFGSLNARAPKRGVSDINAIGAGLGAMQNVRKGFDRYLEGVKTTIGSTDRGLGNAYGAAGEAENAPDYSKPLIDDAYLPGGAMYPFGKKVLPMSASDIASDVEYVKQNPTARDKVIRGEKASGHDTRELERQLQR